MESSSVLNHHLMVLKRNMPYISMVLVNIIYAGMTLFSKAAITKGMNPYVFGVYRQAFAAAALAPFAFFLERHNSAPLSWKVLCKIFLVALFGVTLCLNLFNLGLSYIAATFAAATANATPAITFIMAILLRMESISITKWHGVAKVLGTMLCVIGTLVFAFLKGPPLYAQEEISEASTSWSCRSKLDCIKGSIIILLAQTAWSFWLIMQGPLVKLYPSKLRLTTLQCLFSCVQSAVWAVAVERNISSWKLGLDINLLAVAYCGVIFTGVTYWLRVWVIEKKGPVFAAIFTPLAMIITAIFSAFFWKEILHWGSVCGAILLIMGLFAVLWGKHIEEKSIIIEQKSVTNEETT